MMSQPDTFGLLFSDLDRLDAPGLRSAIDRESRRRLYYIERTADETTREIRRRIRENYGN